MDIHPYVIKSRSELGSKNYIFMENDKIISPTDLFQHLPAAEILSEWKIEFILATIFSKFQNYCKEQTNNKVSSNISLLYKTSSWIWQFSVCKK